MLRTKDAPSGGPSNIAAIQAIGEIRNPAGIVVVRRLLMSADWPSDDVRWECADALEQLTGEPFMVEADPVKVARQWLTDNPDE